MEPLSAFFTLLFVMDPLGNIPIFLSVLKHVDEKRRKPIIIREMCIALLIMAFFLFFGNYFLSALDLNQEAVQISGAIVLMMIAIRMIFSSEGGVMGTQDIGAEPFIVPLAVPMIAGPSAIAILMLMAHDPSDSLITSMAVMVSAWAVCLVIFLLSPLLYRLLKERGLIAVEKLMGMILVMIAVQMGLEGVVNFIALYQS